MATGADGTFRFERAPLAAGGSPRTWAVRAVNGSRTLQQDVTVVAQGEAEVTFRFTESPPDPENRPPMAEIAPIGTISEGDPIRFDASASTDPDGDALSFAWTLLAGDGSTITTGTGPMWTFDSVDDLVATIRLVVSDARDASTTIERPVTVVNAPPAVTIDDVTIGNVTIEAAAPLGIADLAIGALTASTVELRASFTDAGVADTHTVTVDWGDGTSEPMQHAGGAITGSHGYATDGSFAIVVTVCDDDAGCASASRSVTVESGVPIEPPTNPPTDPPTDPPTGPPANPPSTPTPPVIVLVPATPVATPAAPPAVPPGGDPNITLPETGSNPSPLLAAALGLVLLGMVLALTSGRRNPAGRSPTHPEIRQDPF